ncbi:hypothetical protein COV25_02095, partial [candidate division WWE3 bacterium CG10_big_fil_rev_8_21_14_0_10_35_32]
MAKLNINSKIFFPVILALVSLTISINNYQSGSFLSGWDSLHAEFDYSIYWNRITQGVWQEHQGLGAVATQAHASEIPRIIILYFLDLFFSTSAVRWVYFFLMLLIGPIGVYFLTLFLLKPQTKNKELFSMLSGLAYLMNLGTLQHFYAPLEMFATLYGYVGWLFLFTIKYLNENKKRDFYILTLITIFSAPMAHTPTLWFVYFGMLCIFLFGYIIQNFKSNIKQAISKSLLIILMTFATSAYWIFPTIYFVINHSDDVSNAKITRLFSEEAILNNQDYASIWDIAIFKGFLFNWNVHRGDAQFSNIFLDWLGYYGTYNVIWIGYLVFIIAIGAIVYSLIKKEYSNLRPFIPLILVCAIFLGMNFFPFGYIYEFLVKNLSIIKEAFRLPYTKFSIHLMLIISIFFGFGVKHLLDLLSKLKIKWAAPLIGAAFIALLLAYFLPAFNGKLIGDIEKVNIPKDYKMTFDYLNSKNPSRIATLPVHFLFGWLYFDWEDNGKVDASYQGAGFSWFYSKAPIFEREFDRWFPTNEDFYDEYQYAIYSQSSDLLEKVLDKYQIDWILYDRSIIAPGSAPVTLSTILPDFLNSQKFLTKDATYGFIDLYKVNSTEIFSNYVSVPNTYSKTNIKYEFSNIDSGAVLQSSNYINSVDAEIIFPFQDDKSLVSSKDITINLPLNAGGDLYDISVPAYDINEPIPAHVSFSDDLINISYLYPKIHTYQPEYIESKSLSVNEQSRILIGNKLLESSGFSETFLMSKDSKAIIFSEDSGVVTDFSDKIYSAEATDCLGGRGQYGKSYEKYVGSIGLVARDKNNCLNFDEDINSIGPTLYKVSFEYESTKGANPLYCLIASTSGECINEKYKNRPTRSEVFATYEDYVYYDGIDTLRLELILETEDKKNEQKAIFKNIKITRYVVDNVLPIGPSISAYTASEKIYSVKSDQFPLKVVLPDYSDLDSSYLPGSAYFNSERRNCDSFNENSYDRILKNNGNIKYIYSALDAISCDSLDTRVVNSNASYIFTFNSKRISGKGLDICIYSDTLNKCMFQDRLNGSGKEAFILPPYSPAKDIRVNIGNQSIGDVVTENELYGVEVKYIPYKWLKGIYVKPKGAPDFYENGVKISSVSKKAIYKYEVSVEKVESDSTEYLDDGLIILN